MVEHARISIAPQTERMARKEASSRNAHTSCAGTPLTGVRRPTEVSRRPELVGPSDGRHPAQARPSSWLRLELAGRVGVREREGESETARPRLMVLGCGPATTLNDGSKRGPAPIAARPTRHTGSPPSPPDDADPADGFVQRAAAAPSAAPRRARGRGPSIVSIASADSTDAADPRSSHIYRHGNRVCGRRAVVTHSPPPMAVRRGTG